MKNRKRSRISSNFPPKDKLKVHFSSKTVEWATPDDLFHKLSVVYGPFDLDPCASKENAKCEVFITKVEDGLTVDWHDVADRVFMNPPYGRGLEDWVRKAYTESLKGCFVCALLPARTDTSYFHKYIYRRPGVKIQFLKGRVKFGGSKNSAPFPSMIVLFKGKKGD